MKMTIPMNRLEMEKHVNRLKNYSLRKSLNITNDSHHLKRDISKARYLPNGRVNLRTIEVGTRLMANMSYE